MRSRLHRGGSLPGNPNWLCAGRYRTGSLPTDLHHPAVTAYCQKMLLRHASTRERLPFLSEFYQQTLASIAPVHSVLDLACGLNPLTIAHLPLAAGAPYTACDIYSDLAGYLNRFFAHFSIPGTASICDLAAAIPDQPVHLALLLKTIPAWNSLTNHRSAFAESNSGGSYSRLVPGTLAGRTCQGHAPNLRGAFSPTDGDCLSPCSDLNFLTELAFLLSRT